MTNNNNQLSNDGRMMHLCSFWLAERLFGVDILDVKEIGSDVVITPVFHAPDAVSGYMNIRGTIHLVVDLRRLFGFPSKDVDHTSRVILFKPSVDEAMGVLVDRADDVVEISSDRIEERRKKNESNEFKGENRRRNEELTTGVCKLDKRILVVLNVRAIMNAVAREHGTVEQK